MQRCTNIRPAYPFLLISDLERFGPRGDGGGFIDRLITHPPPPRLKGLIALGLQNSAAPGRWWWWLLLRCYFLLAFR